MPRNLDDYLNTIQCLWEAVVESHRNDVEAQQNWDSIGTPILRSQFRQPEIIEACMEGWTILKEIGRQGEMAPFDFEYVPWFVDECLNWEPSEARVSVKEDWRDILEHHAANLSPSPSF